MQRFKYELTLLFAGTGIKFALGFYVLTAIFAAIQGTERIAHEKESHRLVSHHFETKLSDWQTKVIEGKKDLGLMGYYLLSPTVHTASAWATLIYGQRDLDLLQQHIRLLALEGQIHATEINNPESQITGFVDVGFVLVYLLPLIIGLMCATLYAHEESKNRWALLTALAGSGMAVLTHRLLLRFMVLASLNFIILGTAMTIADIAFDRDAAIIFLGLVIYQLFWFSLCGLIIQLRLKTATSTLSFIAAWLALTVIIPGIGNLYLTNRYSTDEGIALVLKQRQVMNDSWENDKKTAFEKFLQLYPNYADTPPLNEPFDWKWYYAMQQLSDVAASPHLEKYVSVINKRVEASHQLALLSAPLNFHQILTQIAQTDANSRNQYLEQVRNYHRQLRDFYYARLFYPTAISAADFATLPRFVYQASTPVTPWKSIIFLLLSVVMVCAVLMYVKGGKKLQWHSPVGQ